MIRWLIILHATTGALALITGFVALASTKGGKVHRGWGKWFYRIMLFSALLATNIALLPDHSNPFLFSIGLFSTYLLLSGRRAALLQTADRTSWLISAGMILAGLGMLIIPVITSNKLNLIMMSFALIGLGLAVRDLIVFKSEVAFKNSRIAIHGGNMTGGYIAALTAFIVVNELLPGVWAWFAPTIIGTPYIVYQLSRYRQASSSKGQDLKA